MQYETKLEELRRLRKDSRVLKGKKGLAENAMIRRIHFIYERATRKFRGDLRLWSAWLEFCKETNSRRKLSQVTHPCSRCTSKTPIFTPSLCHYLLLDWDGRRVIVAFSMTLVRHCRGSMQL